MCGIVGYNGLEDARSLILEGLEKLEYRGYDSAGLALADNGHFFIKKTVGKPENLIPQVPTDFETHVGIGHTRWATHGQPSIKNSHPHVSQSGRFALVHNGVIENYELLKEEYLKDYIFKSDTDSEVIVDMIDYFSKKGYPTQQAILKTLNLLEGSFALLILDQTDLGRIYFAKYKTPLVVGLAKDGVLFGSDVMPLLGHCTEGTVLKDGTFGVSDGKEVKYYDFLGNERHYDYQPITGTDEELGKGGYDTYMLKEIHEEPEVIRRIIQEYFHGDEIKISPELINMIRRSDKINLVACGTSMHACYMAKYFFEKLCRIPSEVFCASELIYSTPLILNNPCFIFLSQSGETADSIACLKKFREAHYPIITITNNPNSTMANLADYNLELHCGKEIAVASTKAYVAQVVVASILAKAVSGRRTSLKIRLADLALNIETILKQEDKAKKIAEEIKDATDVFFIGRGLDYWSAMEASLKLKEISYIHSEAFPSGELKHGTIALIDKTVPVIALCTQTGTNPIVRSNLIETTSRGAQGHVISMSSCHEETDDFVVPEISNYLAPLETVVVCQLIAYYVATMKGNDVDKPKNLAKSVTVE